MGSLLGRSAHETGAAGFADGAATYIVRYAPDSTISLVDASTVVAGARSFGGGFAPFGPAARVHKVGCAGRRPARALRRLQGVRCGSWPSKAQNVTCCGCDRLPRSARGYRWGAGPICPLACADAALEASPTTLGLALPGEVQLLQGNGHEESVEVPGTARATQFLPVQGVVGRALVPGENVVGMVGVRSGPRWGGNWPRGPEGIRPGRRAGCAGLLGR